MPPKTNGNANPGKDIIVLCQLMMSTAEPIKFDAKKAAAALGIAQPNNVPRKINSIIGPYGFEMKGGTIVSNNDGEGSASVPATPGKGAEGGDQAAKEPKTPKAQSARKKKELATPKTNEPKTPANKKRKVNAAAAEDGEIDNSGAKAEDEMETGFGGAGGQESSEV